MIRKEEITASSSVTKRWFLNGGGENAVLIGSMDWSETGLGPIEEWPDTLKASVNACLNAKIPITVLWGPELRMIYNDRYREVLGPYKHPGAMGATGEECWREVWDIAGPLLTGVYRTGEAFLGELLLLEMNRLVPREETYFQVSYAPIFVPNGEVGGLFAICPDITNRVVSERRLRTLIDLGTHALEAKSEEDGCRIAAASLGSNQADVPFALIYLKEADADRLRLIATTGFKARNAWTPEIVELGTEGDSVWLLRSAMEGGCAQLMRNIAPRFGALPGGPWQESPDAALVLPLGGAEQASPVAVLVAGLSPHRLFDAPYRSFLETIAGHIGNAIANGRVREAERRRIEELSKLDRAKDEFLATLSHELRSPLQALSGWISVLRAEGADPSQRTRALDAIDRSLRAETDLVQDLLEVSWLLAGKAEIERTPVNLAEVIADTAEEVQPLTEAKGIALSVEAPASAFVIGDRNRLTQVMRNLLSNAIKFTWPSGHIEVTCSAVERSLVVQVRDDGEGIAEEFLPLVFSRFSQANTRRTRHHSGLGLGLAIVRHFVELHGGEVEAASAGVGRGSIFTLRLPQAPVELVAESRTSAKKPLRDDPGELTGLRILLVEDNPDVREVLLLMLEQAGAEVTTAGLATEAFNAFKSSRPDLIVSDLGMPDEDGYSLMGRIRSFEGDAANHTPAIALSGYASSADRARSVAAGFHAHIAKPVDFEILVVEIRNLCRPHREQ
jgi:signal transduction histidine kinase